MKQTPATETSSAVSVAHAMVFMNATWTAVTQSIIYVFLVFAFAMASVNFSLAQESPAATKSGESAKKAEGEEPRETSESPKSEPPKREPPPTPTLEEADQMLIDGDRFADQDDYRSALEKYTEAYHAIVGEIRGQKFQYRVRPSMLTREDLSTEMKQMMVEEYTPEELRLMESTFKAFKLVPQDLNVTSTMTSLLTEEVGGFYDPKDKRMVLILESASKKNPGMLARLFGARPAFDKESQKTTLAHEMTHALQDQLYDLQTMDEGMKHDDDMRTAFSALVEGDATLLMFAEGGRQDGSQDSIEQMDPEMARRMFSIMQVFLPFAGGKTYRTAPPILRDSLIFPYLQGMVFNLYLTRKGGWQAIDQAYQDPPLSTEQIMHPSKYYDPELRDNPTNIELPDLAGLLGDEVEYLGGNCMGELSLSIMFKNVRGGRKAAEGWDGDQYGIFALPENRLGLAWFTNWDSDQDAEEFAKAYKDYIAASDAKATEKLQSASNEIEASEAESQPATRDTITAKTDLRIEVRGADVVIVQGFDEESSIKLMTELWTSKKTPKTFTKPAAKN